MKEVTLSRNELYELVWSEPVTAILKKYFLTDSEFRKICSGMEVPLPKSGHWQKVKAGKSLSTKPLPEKYNGEMNATFLQREEGEEHLVPLSPLQALQKEIEEDSSINLIVPKKLNNPDKLINIAHDVLTNRNANKVRYPGMVFSSDHSVDIRVSPNNVDRALRFMDTFIKALRERGHKVEIKNNNTYVVVDGQDLQVTLREKTRRQIVNDNNWERTENVPTGILSVQIGKYSFDKIEIMDGKLLIEDQLSKIIAKLELEGKKEKEERLAIEKYWAEQREKERIKLDYEKLKENELASFKALFSKANRWNQAMILRKYLDEVEIQAKSKGQISEELNIWLTWARKKVDWYDPFVDAEDELLSNVDKDTLTSKTKKSASLWDFN